MQKILVQCAVTLAIGGAAVAAAAHPRPVIATEFPVELRETWDPSAPCTAGEVSDHDARFSITRRQRLNYEEIEDIVSAELLTSSPMTWRIVTTSNVGPPDLALPTIYIMRDDYLATSDGSNARGHLRCR